MKNSRHYMRFSVKCGGCLTDERLRQYRFTVVNISGCGMNITTTEQIKDTKSFRINFDNSGLLIPHIRQIKGAIAREKATEKGYVYGIRFEDITPMQSIEIDEYLRFRLHHSDGHSADRSMEDAYTEFASYK